MGVPAEEVLEAIPQREPFLFVDSIVEKGAQEVKTLYQVTGEESFFRGHFPGNPIMPGVLLLEACFQSGAVLMAQESSEAGLGVVSRVSDVKFRSLVRPGDQLDIEVSLVERVENAFFMSAKIRVAGKIAAAVKFTGTLIPSE